MEKFRQERKRLDQVQAALVELGCYVGEVIVRHLNGTWMLGEDTGIPIYEAYALVIQLLNGIHCHPLNKVYKRFEDGAGDSLVLYYSSLEQLCTDAWKEPGELVVQDNSSFKWGPIGSALFRLGVEVDARTKALQFVHNVEGRIEDINTEVNRQLDRISAGDEKGPMAPGASPQRWIEHYVSTLREAKSLIEAITREGKTGRPVE